MIALLVSVYVLGIAGAAFVIGRLVPDDLIEENDAQFLGVILILWPLLLALFVVVFPFYTVYRLGKGKS